jgi:hypothetical protein
MISPPAFSLPHPQTSLRSKPNGQQKTRAPKNLGGGQVPDKNGLTFSRR